MNYLWDVFISYKRNSTIAEWIENIFLKKFTDYLNNALAELGRPAKIFIDNHEIEPGDKWPEYLKEALRSSKCMFAILSPEYVWRSEWCPIEFSHMLYRDEAFRKVHPQLKLKSIFPIVFMKFRTMPSVLSSIQYCDYTRFNLTGEAFWKDAKGLDFQQQLQKDVNKLADIILNVPQWQDYWTPENDYEKFHQQFIASLRDNNNQNVQQILPGWAG